MFHCPCSFILSTPAHNQRPLELGHLSYWSRYIEMIHCARASRVRTWWDNRTKITAQFSTLVAVLQRLRNQSRWTGCSQASISFSYTHLRCFLWGCVWVHVFKRQNGILSPCIYHSLQRPLTECLYVWTRFNRHHLGLLPCTRHSHGARHKIKLPRVSVATGRNWKCVKTSQWNRKRQRQQAKARSPESWQKCATLHQRARHPLPPKYHTPMY